MKIRIPSLRALSALPLLLAGALDAQTSENPLDGYSGYTNSYFLQYADSTGFGPGNSSDAKVTVDIGGLTTLDLNLDTGSRGLYVDANTLGTNFTTNAGSFYGDINLTSSGRDNEGYWTPTTLSFAVTDQNNNPSTVSETIPILAVEAVQATKDAVTFGMMAETGTAVIVESNGTTNSLSFSNATVTLSLGQKMYYSNNPLLSSVSNFGVGFDLNGQGTGPIASNTNQIYNPFLNLDAMKSGSLVAGYIVETNGVQLGLTQKTTNFAYTSLNPTGFASTNSVPDWQTPTGKIVIGGVTNAPGSVVLDSGIGYSFLSVPGYTNGALSNPTIGVQLINSGGAVGYTINADSNNALNPSFDNPADGSNNVFLSPPGTNGIYSQNKQPYGSQYFNSGRNVFDAFSMLYDAQNGYVGLLTNSYGATNPDVTFQSGYFSDPVPEPSTTGLCLLGFLGVLGVTELGVLRRLSRTRTKV